MRGLIGMLAGAALVSPALAAAPGMRGGGATMGVGHAAVGGMARPGGWGAGGWSGGGVRPMPPMQGHPMPGRPGGFHGGYGGGFNGGFGGGFGGGFVGYRRPFVGYVIPSTFIAPTYAIGNWSSYGLASPAAGYGWYRYYDDAVMVDGGGRVRDWRGGIDWDRSGGAQADRAYDAGYDDGYDDGFDDGSEYAEDAVGYRGTWKRGKAPQAGREGARHGGSYGGVYAPVAPGGPLIPPPPMRDGWRPGYGYGNAYGTGYRAGPGTMVYGGGPGQATVVVVQNAPSTVTTTTTTTTSWAAPKRVWSAPKRVWHAAPKRCIAKGKTLCR